jgi:hypothetical protein
MTVPFALQPNTAVTYRAETTFGQLAPNDGTARRFRANAGDGLQAAKARIESNEIKPNLMRQIARHGSRGAAGELGADLSLGTFDPLLEAATRGTFSAVLSLTGLTISFDTATGTVTRSTGSFLADGVRVGDVITFGGIGGQSGIPFIVSQVAALTLIVGNRQDMTASISNVAGASLTRPKKAIMPQAAQLVRRSFSIEHHQPGITASEMFLGCRLASLALALPAGGLAQATFGFVGQDFALRTGGQAPYFTTPTTTTAEAFAVADVRYSLGGLAQAAVVDCSLSIDLGVSSEEVGGALVTPDVFDGQATVGGSITILRSGTTNLASFIAESTLSFTALLRNAAGDFIAVSLPLLKLSEPQATRIGSSNAIRETFTLDVGEASGADRDPTMLAIITSAA